MRNTGTIDLSNEEQSFATEMRRLRESVGMNQKQFTAALLQAGIRLDQAAVSRIEKGKRRVSMVEGDAIAQTLRTTVRDMMYPDAGNARLQQMRAYLHAADDQRAQLVQATTQLARLRYTLGEELQQLDAEQADIIASGRAISPTTRRLRDEIAEQIDALRSVDFPAEVADVFDREQSAREGGEA